ncbi:A/G-specific adenine glycosylase [Thermotalea metallivorans]|uniref:Adenine DNA glycosylase n=1 Tax=Thermotalea metallivorans TaxID=520762 RepID=A0A140L408_9FIRM|nr:A/G-specific adenine glycosylase [Thermotalea metallivorans]KXG75283.1 putative A/G-specific adenine glycosylase YfhQ [Thermotalea metallivorans]
MEMYKTKDWEKFDQDWVKGIQENLICWYRQNHRKLPWRETQNPYAIWVSEVMLQQTRVETVIPYFQQFMEKFPTVEALAKAHEEEVLKAWEGLGYYSRARNLHRGAKVVAEHYGGRIPHRLKEIKKIPGIGSYTAGAILSIAYGQPVPAVDGNVMRVFSRVFCVQEDIGGEKTKKEMEKIGAVVIPPENPSFFNQGLMELGALICTPIAPKCIACPIFEACCARQKGIQHELPIKKKKTKVKEVFLEVGLVWKGDKLLITKRPGDSLLAGLWGFPAVEREKGWERGKSIRQELKDTYGMEVTGAKHVLDATHIFTHLKWHMEVYVACFMEEAKIEYPPVQWVTLKEIKQYPIPTAFRKVLKKIKEIDDCGKI